jgi:predicted DNA binding CopG/RHH family protein
LKSTKKYTAAGTDIEEVKKKNAASGLSYNEVKRQLAERHQSRNK